MRLKEQIAILALGAGFAGCTPNRQPTSLKITWSLHSNNSGLL
ncbi:hypothetical protein SFC43_20880 [Bacteroides sp. CR5/BHMF/2]|nr:hypothetical protein [Bacteroides sp. CR5/BHMF/2]